MDRGRKETLETMWLLREEVLSRKDSWKATRGALSLSSQPAALPRLLLTWLPRRVGTSIFTRIK